MKKEILSILSISVLLFTSCQKEEESKDRFADEVSSEEEHLRLPESNFDKIITEPLVYSEEGYYSSGVIHYMLNGEEQAVINYGSEKGKAEITKGNEKKKIALKKKEEEKEDKEFYKKIIVEPIVVTDDCEYIVSGIIKYFDKKTGEWLATVDFGDGTCEDIATKYTKEGEYIFNIGDYIEYFE